MQSAARLVGSGLAGKNDKDEGGDEVMTDVDLSTTITVRTIEEIAGVVPDAVVNRLIDAMQPRKGKSTYQGVFNAVTDIVADGWSATQLLSQVRLQGAYLFLFGH
jgi:replication factor C subunit 2/4